ncbi:helix-turn-helix domain-containing protein [bacterium]|nr:helix-turn-helix domain-containing protein [bacterium]|tara:strand:+ start:837 stop:1187 length:351 start_codon:yes stop_codon:yes gene_type:complete
MNNPFEAIEARLNCIEALLLDLKHISKEQGEQPKTDKLLTVRDAAEFLSLSVPTIYNLINKGELPVMKRSKRCYFLKAELISYLKQGRKKTLAEITNEAEQYCNKRGLANKKQSKF